MGNEVDPSTQGARQLRHLAQGLLETTQRVERELVGFEHLAGALLAYARGLPGYDPQALHHLAQYWLRSGEWSPDDPALDPFERLEAVLRSEQGHPVDARRLPKELQRGFPSPPTLRPVPARKSDPEAP